jgi:RNA polymerase sigma factor (TIGR02999 family)
MRRVLIDHARSRQRLKRGGPSGRRLPASVIDLLTAPDPQDVLTLDEALTRLEQQSPDVAAVVRLRFFGGLSIDQTAEALGKSPRSIDRDWAYARAWLHEALTSDGPAD